MKPQLKISGKKMDAPEASKENWKFERRPGGWVIGTCTVETQEKRVRFTYEKFQKKFFAKVSGAFNANEFFGERIEVSRGAGSAQSASDLTAQFPGKVRKILVAEAQTVTAGTPLMMVEAMKMEFAVKAHADGKVKKVLVHEGQVLTPGQLLIDFEETKK